MLLLLDHAIQYVEMALLLAQKLVMIVMSSMGTAAVRFAASNAASTCLIAPLALARLLAPPAHLVTLFSQALASLSAETQFSLGRRLVTMGTLWTAMDVVRCALSSARSICRTARHAVGRRVAVHVLLASQYKQERV